MRPPFKCFSFQAEHEMKDWVPVLSAGQKLTVECPKLAGRDVSFEKSLKTLE
jgi:hypothetical protein